MIPGLFVLLCNCNDLVLCTMQIASIKEWLSNPNRSYSVGVALFGHYGTNAFLKKLFSKGEDDYNFSRLIKELQIIVDTNENPLPPPVQEPIGEIESDAAPADNEPPVPEEYTKYQGVAGKVDISRYPEELQKMIAEKGELYRQATHLHSRLMHLPTDKERAKDADLIVQKYRRIMEIWAEVDYYEEYKIMRPKSLMDIANFTIIQLLKRRNTLRTYISKNKHQPDGEKYKQFVAELQSVQMLIDKKEEDDGDN